MGGWDILFGVLGLGITVLCVMACAHIAQQKGYSPVLAGCLGFFFGWIVLAVYYFLLPDTGMGGGSGLDFGERPARGRTPRNVPPPPPPGVCRVCGFDNGRASRCDQCGNTLV